jgi:hypothetical protein
VAYAYGRFGVAVRLGVEQLDQIGLEGDLWSGHLYDEDSPQGRSFLWVVPGLVFTHAL